jgi:hypothetical protein
MCAKMESCSKQSPLIYPLWSVTQHRSDMNFVMSAVLLVLPKVTATWVTFHPSCLFRTQPQLHWMRRHSFSIAGFQGFGQWLSETGSFWWAWLSSCLFTWGWKLIQFPNHCVLMLDAGQSLLVLNTEPCRTSFWYSLFPCQGRFRIGMEIFLMHANLNLTSKLCIKNGGTNILVHDPSNFLISTTSRRSLFVKSKTQSLTLEFASNNKSTRVGSWFYVFKTLGLWFCFQ